mgnify:CR=1 FL=1|tara:strand:- start:634 stop:1611 length:978 start_codon:yes stop_codon:yes gene_type:complete
MKNIIAKKYTLKKENESKNNYCVLGYRQILTNLITDDENCEYEYVSLKKEVICKYDYGVLEKFQKISNRFKSFNLDFFNNKNNTSKLFKNEYFLPKIFSKTKKYSNNEYWFMKPIEGCQGKGIFVTKNPLKYDIDKYNIQQDICPNLIDGRRWDLRTYVFAIFDTVKNKLNLYIYKDGLVRICSNKFTNYINIKGICSNTSLTDKEDRENFILQRNFKNLNNYELIFNKILQILKRVKYLIKNNIINKKNYILETHIFGFDFIIDKNNDPYIIEVNTKPSFILKKQKEYPLISKMKENVINDLYYLIKNKYNNEDINLNNNFHEI